MSSEVRFGSAIDITMFAQQFLCRLSNQGLATFNPSSACPTRPTERLSVAGRASYARSFEGSQHHDKGYFQPLQGAGASLNGSTNADRTNYWEVVPTEALDLALWMESDRMGYLLPALTEAKFENQREVVLNERRQNYENKPYGLA